MWNNEGHNLGYESYEYWDPERGLERHCHLSGRGAGFAALPRLDGVLAALVRVGDRMSTGTATGGIGLRWAAER